MGVLNQLEDHKSKPYYQSSFDEDDKMGFTTPVAPGHSLKLLNEYMRTDLLRSIHEKIRHRMDQKRKGSPLKHLADSLAEVIEIHENLNLFECVERNPFYFDPSYKFDAKNDYYHDIKLMKFHLNAHLKTLSEIG